MRLGVWGGNGSFTEEAALTYAKRSVLDSYSIEHFDSIDEELEALEKGHIDLAIFPMRNSLGGVVHEAANITNKFSFIEKDELKMEIHQNLLVSPGTKLEDIGTVISHYQPLQQCRRFIERILPNAVVQECNDMSIVAANIAQFILPRSSAVIASKRIAEIYGLDILAADIQDSSANITTFRIASKT
ncbi:MAG: prephenate dehydratase domain-containing protein [Candidatus Paceibacterota bacterium]